VRHPNAATDTVTYCHGERDAHSSAAADTHTHTYSHTVSDRHSDTNGNNCASGFADPDAKSDNRASCFTDPHTNSDAGGADP
jgi:hypothetical protein